MIPGTLAPTYYRGCWHVVSRGLFPRYRPVSSLGKGVYNPKAFVPHATSLGQAFAHCPRFPAAASRRSGGRSQSPSGWSSSQTSYRHRLGRPLPHQQPDRTRAPPPATGAFHLHPKECRSYAGLSSVSRGYTPPEGRLLTRYSAVCRFIIVAEATITLDLHALSAPPAFTLSQDQTLLMRTLLPFTIQLLKCLLRREAKSRQRRLRLATLLH